MNLFNKNNNSGSRFIKLYSTCLKCNHEYSKGFTIVEAMVAIFILSVSVATMLGITASSAATARYANNEITANYLLQEAVDSIRNSRDTMVFQNKRPWTDFLSKYGYIGNKCFSTNGCILLIENFDPSDINSVDDVASCNGNGGVCPYLLYDDDPTNYKTFYNYTSSTGYESVFRRTVNMAVDNDNPDQLNITVKVEWYNGDESNKRSQSLTFYLLNWQKG